MDYSRYARPDERNGLTKKGENPELKQPNAKRTIKFAQCDGVPNGGQSSEILIADFLSQVVFHPIATEPGEGRERSALLFFSRGVGSTLVLNNFVNRHSDLLFVVELQVEGLRRVEGLSPHGKHLLLLQNDVKIFELVACLDHN